MDGDASSSSGSKKFSFAQLATRPTKILYDLNSGLRTRCTLEQLYNKREPWKDPLRKDKITRKYQLVFRHVIQAIYNLNRKNITKGYLRLVDIMTGGSDEEATTTWLTNPL
ncbi:hypothetical protein Pyn_25728 [Prunus yedoensis var. nudiflora]|uniref:Uncharacterized protein n=1 Tax=Prunus yedoensis var. nudiflora TaxID=2094558 RepID=A0A314ZMG2_PRUYE|nr:hypothetical protein Pyn_25728 [Prunus yedoensis var. nudiflora]